MRLSRQYFFVKAQLHETKRLYQKLRAIGWKFRNKSFLFTQRAVEVAT